MAPTIMSHKGMHLQFRQGAELLAQVGNVVAVKQEASVPVACTHQALHDLNSASVHTWKDALHALQLCTVVRTTCMRRTHCRLTGTESLASLHIMRSRSSTAVRNVQGWQAHCRSSSTEGATSRHRARCILCTVVKIEQSRHACATHTAA